MARRLRLGKSALLAPLLLLLLPLAGFTASSSVQYQGYASGHGTDGYNVLQLALTCRVPALANGHGCTGNGQGVFGGKYFAVTDIPTNNNPSSLTCPTVRCDGGAITVSGYGWLGVQQVAFSFCGYDSDPSRVDRMSIVIYGPPAASTLNSSAIGLSGIFGPTCSTSAASPIHPSPIVFSGVAYSFPCSKGCFEFVRSKH